MKIISLVLFMALFITGCVASKPTGIECTNPRPEMCAMNYDPVCATRDNKVRCVTTPCESTELITYGNACSACSNPDVYHYQPGACEDKAAGHLNE
jgi:PBP1b-binding outer membrane lipoprotein LpoB